MFSKWLHIGRRRTEAIGLCRFGELYRGVHARRVGDAITVHPIPVAETVRTWPSPMRRLARQQGVAFAIQDLSLHHERMQLPPMEPALRARAVEQHCLASRAVGSDLEISHLDDLAEDQPGSLLIVSVDRQVSQEYADLLQADGFRPERFLSASAALVALLRASGREGLGAGSTAVIHLGSEIGSVAFVADGAFVIGREFRMPEPPAADGQGSESAGPTDADRQGEILEEIDRSLLLFHHQLHGRSVQRILLSADDEPLEALRRRCTQRFGIEAQALIDRVALDASAFGEGELGQRRAGLWALPIAAAVTALHGEWAIDLLPAVSKAERARRRMLGIATALILTAGAGMGLHHALRGRVAAELIGELGAHAIQQEEMDAQVAELAEIGAARTAAHHRLALLSRKQTPVLMLEGLLNLLAASAPESLVVEQLDFGAEPGRDARWMVRVQGKVSSENSADVQNQFARFHTALRRSPLFAQARVQPIEIRQPAGSRQSVLDFDILVPLTTEDPAGDAAHER